MKRRVISSVMVIVLLLTFFPIVPVKAISFTPRLSLPSDARSTVKYYKTDSSPGWGNYNPYNMFNVGNCTWYAFGRAWEILGYFPDSLVFSGDAYAWFGGNKKLYDSGKGGFPYSTDPNAPALGAIACFSRDGSPNSGGHVAVVEQISDNGNGSKTIVTSESGYSSYYFKTVSRNTSQKGLGWSSYTFQGYIYVNSYPIDDNEPLLPPATVTASSAEYMAGDTISITWSPVSNADFYAFQINKNGENILWDRVGKATSYTTNSLDMGSYEFYVWAYKNSGKKSISNYCKFEVVQLTRPQAVETAQETYTVGEPITVNWSAVSHADFYAFQINRYGENILWERVGKNTSYTTSSLDVGSYEFYVWAYKGSGIKSISNFCRFEVVPAQCAHVFDSGFTVQNATCNDTGIQEFTCTICGETKNEILPALGHDLVIDPAVAPTCTTAGLSEGSHCTTCDYKIVQQLLPPLGHDWSDWVETVSPQVGKEGQEVRVCTRCKAAEYRSTEPLSGSRFEDVPAGKFYSEPVQWAVANGITSGKTDTAFAPEEVCTRAQVVTFLWRACGSPKPSSSKNPFVDVQPGRFYYDAVLWAAEKGITGGVDRTHFAPNDTVTRAQFVTFLYRAKGKPTVSGSNPLALHGILGDCPLEEGNDKYRTRLKKYSSLR